MCFTIEIKLTRDALEKRFNADASALTDYEFRYFYRAFDNPMIPVITQSHPSRIELMKWGLIPSWANSLEHAETIRRGTYNARAETISEKPAFKNSFQHSRCWVLANGFFEWQHVGKDKIPWYITLENNQPFAFAGIYDSWTNPETGIKEKTFSIVTTRANRVMEKIHNTKKRMPVILTDQAEKQWIKHETGSEKHSMLLNPYTDNELRTYTVSKIVGSGATDPLDKRLIMPHTYFKNKTLFD